MRRKEYVEQERPESKEESSNNKQVEEIIEEIICSGVERYFSKGGLHIIKCVKPINSLYYVLY